MLERQNDQLGNQVNRSRNKYAKPLFHKDGGSKGEGERNRPQKSVWYETAGYTFAEAPDGRPKEQRGHAGDEQANKIRCYHKAAIRPGPPPVNRPSPNLLVKRPRPVGRIRFGTAKPDERSGKGIKTDRATHPKKEPETGQEPAVRARERK